MQAGAAPPVDVAGVHRDAELLLAPDPITEPSLTVRTTRGVAWQLSGSVLARLIGIGVQLVTARYLIEADFGLVGIAMAMAAFGGLLTNPGLDTVAVQRQRNFRLWAGPLFWLSFTCGVLGAIGITLAGIVGASLYEQPIVARLSLIVAATALVGSFNLVPVALLSIQMRFRFQSTLAVARGIGTSIITIFLAVRGYGPYSLVVPGLVIALAECIVLWRYARPAGVRRVRLHRWRHMFSDAGSLLGVRALLTLREQGDYIVLGLVASPAVLGTYFFAFTLVSQAMRFFGASIATPLLVAMGRVESGGGDSSGRAVDAARLLIGIAFAAAGAVIGLMDPLMHVLFGARWEGAIPIAQILTLALAFEVGGWPIGAMLLAQRRTRMFLLLSAVYSPLFVVMAAIGAAIGMAMGVAWAVLLFYAVGGPIWMWLVLRSVRQYRVRQVFGLYARPITLFVLVLAPVWLISLWLQTRMPNWAVVLCLVPFSIALAAASARLVMPWQWQLLWQIGSGLLPRRRPVIAPPAAPHATGGASC